MPISDSVQIGQNVFIPQPALVNLYGCTIGDDSKIGAFVEIQKNCSIGKQCKISSHSFLCEGVHPVSYTHLDVYKRQGPPSFPI